MLATGEWTMTNNNLNYKEYAKLAGGFYPSKFDADKWVAAIKAWHTVPNEENLKAREEFQDNKFGIFLHWGLYAML